MLFLAGPSGVGKSQTATKVAAFLNPIFQVIEGSSPSTELNVKRINLNEGGDKPIRIRESLQSSILIAIKDTPTSVIILEEWDKMKKGEKDNLLQMLESTQTYVKERIGTKKPL